MQRKSPQCFASSVAMGFAAVAGLVVGLQVQTNPVTTRGNDDAYFAMQAYTSDAFALTVKPSPCAYGTAGCVDPDRERATGVETERIDL